MKLAQGLLLAPLFVILLVSPSVSARPLLPRYQGPSLEKQEDNIFHLMGWEECGNKDEECLQRRMISEAHLDYIYTQHHKPKP